MLSFIDLPPDLIRLVAIEMPLFPVLCLARSNNRIYATLFSSEFWKVKQAYDFPESPPISPCNYYGVYLRCYSESLCRSGENSYHDFEFDPQFRRLESKKRKLEEQLGNINKQQKVIQDEYIKYGYSLRDKAQKAFATSYALIKESNRRYFSIMAKYNILHSLDRYRDIDIYELGEELFEDGSIDFPNFMPGDLIALYEKENDTIPQILIYINSYCDLSVDRCLPEDLIREMTKQNWKIDDLARIYNLDFDIHALRA